MKNIICEENLKQKSPDLKYYAFDWDDNIVHMPTKIILVDKNNDEVEMTTDDFAKFRHQVGKKPFKYNGKIITDFASNPFRNFKVGGDRNFIIDAMRAKLGPAFNDFKEAINNGSIFAIITARGHNPETIKEAIYNYIVTGFGGINKEQLIKNLKKFRKLSDDEDSLSDEELIRSYLELNKYNPVSFGDEKNSLNPEDAKIDALENFITYVKVIANSINKKAFVKNGISNNFIPSKIKIGFSDDDPKNIEAIKNRFDKTPEDLLTIYSTSGGVKKKI
jgi:hypothetical protein